jgi:hypothetical protein
MQFCAIVPIGRTLNFEAFPTKRAAGGAIGVVQSRTTAGFVTFLEGSPRLPRCNDIFKSISSFDCSERILNVKVQQVLEQKVVADTSVRREKLFEGLVA